MFRFFEYAKLVFFLDMHKFRAKTFASRRFGIRVGVGLSESVPDKKSSTSSVVRVRETVS